MRRALPCPRRSTLLDKIRKPLEGFPDCRLPPSSLRAWQGREGEAHLPSLLSPPPLLPTLLSLSLSPPPTTSQGSRHRRRRPPLPGTPSISSVSSSLFSTFLPLSVSSLGRRQAVHGPCRALPPPSVPDRRSAGRGPTRPLSSLFSLLGCAGVPAGANGPCGPSSLPRGKTGRQTGGRSSACHHPFFTFQQGPLAPALLLF